MWCHRGNGRCLAFALWNRDNLGLVKTHDPANIPAEWREEFEAAARRPLAVRLRYAFIHPYKPVLDDASYRSFQTMKEYRDWCDKNLPPWLGYGRV